ncbi:MAG: GPMC system MBL fold metallohydrolase [bacterium]|nr:GPMC system MBL fold metallohydrolase [bacterium]
MRITILGSGTSTGVPLIGCDCDVCSSTDSRNRRTRSSILISSEAGNILVDTSTDLRYQALENGIRRIDAVLFTHAHADHVHGIDELRSFNFIQKKAIPCFGNATTLDRIQRMFSYIFKDHNFGGGIPQLTMNEVADKFSLLDEEVVPVEVIHGDLPILGYRIADIAYITDCSEIPVASMEKLKGLDLLILGALRYTKHDTHFSVDEAMDVVRALKPERALFTHLGHDLDYEKAVAALPENVGLAYDGMTMEFANKSR